MAYFSKEKFIDILNAKADMALGTPKKVFLSVAKMLEALPPSDVAEVKHGEWIYKHRHRGGFERRTVYDEFNNPHTITLDNRYECDEPYCSVCGKIGGDFLNYCGNCGAKMDGGKTK